jgi:hypothetical protein
MTASALRKLPITWRLVQRPRWVGFGSLVSLEAREVRTDQRLPGPAIEDRSNASSYKISNVGFTEMLPKIYDHPHFLNPDL